MILSQIRIDQGKQVGHQKTTRLLTVSVLKAASSESMPLLDSHEVPTTTLGIKEREIKSGLSAETVVKILSFANTLSTAGAGPAYFLLSLH